MTSLYYITKFVVKRAVDVYLLLFIIIAFTLIEIVLSVWEHIFIFNMYIEKSKEKITKLERVIRAKAVKIKPVKIKKKKTAV
ncbi:hypothetical protein ACFL96_08300, partial [Thermoproteota archaeon]